MKSHLLTFIPFAAAAALACVVSPLHAGPPVGHGGGTGGHAHSSSGGGIHVSVGGGGGHGENRGSRVGTHSGGSVFQGSHFSAPGEPAFRRGPRFRVRYGFVFPDLYASSTGGSVSSSDADSSGYAYADPDTSGGGDASTADPTSFDPVPTPVPSMGTSVQVALANAGYYNGAITGVIGPGSSVAIAAFQRTHGLPPTGLIDMYLLHALGLYQ